MDIEQTLHENEILSEVGEEEYIDQRRFLSMMNNWVGLWLVREGFAWTR